MAGKQVVVTRPDGQVVVIVHKLNVKTLARVLAIHSNDVPLIRAAFSEQAPDVLAELDAGS